MKAWYVALLIFVGGCGLTEKMVQRTPGAGGDASGEANATGSGNDAAGGSSADQGTADTTDETAGNVEAPKLAVKLLLMADDLKDGLAKVTFREFKTGRISNLEYKVSPEADATEIALEPGGYEATSVLTDAKGNVLASYSQFLNVTPDTKVELVIGGTAEPSDVRRGYSHSIAIANRLDMVSYDSVFSCSRGFSGGFGEPARGSSGMPEDLELKADAGESARLLQKVRLSTFGRFKDLGDRTDQALVLSKELTYAFSPADSVKAVEKGSGFVTFYPIKAGTITVTAAIGELTASKAIVVLPAKPKKLDFALRAPTDLDKFIVADFICPQFDVTFDDDAVLNVGLDHPLLATEVSDAKVLAKGDKSLEIRGHGEVKLGAAIGGVEVERAIKVSPRGMRVFNEAPKDLKFAGIRFDAFGNDRMIVTQSVPAGYWAFYLAPDTGYLLGSVRSFKGVTSSDPAVLEVVPESYGATATAKAPGQAELQVSYAGKRHALAIEVVDLRPTGISVQFLPDKNGILADRGRNDRIVPFHVFMHYSDGSKIDVSKSYDIKYTVATVPAFTGQVFSTNSYSTDDFRHTIVPYETREVRIVPTYKGVPLVDPASATTRIR